MEAVAAEEREREGERVVVVVVVVERAEVATSVRGGEEEGQKEVVVEV